MTAFASIFKAYPARDVVDNCGAFVLSVVIVILLLIGDVTVLPHVQVATAGVLLFLAESVDLQIRPR